jgi:hypothetical protein
LRINGERSLNKTSLAFGLIALLIAVLSVTTYITLNSQQTFVAGATVKTANANIGVYSDSRCTTALSAVTWGDLKPGDTKTFSVYIKNLGTSKIALSMTTSTWSPPNVAQSITVSWNQEKASIAAGKIVQATIKLAVSQSVNNTINSFSFNVQIAGISP